jgi:class 3 adenylate cyclase
VRWLTIDSARRLAASLPNARLQLLSGAAGLPYAGDMRETLDAIRQFLGVASASVGDPRVRSAGDESQRSGTAVILFADIVESTALTERLGDTAFREKARALDGALRIAVRDNGGAAIDGKLLGDGILATFPAASQAIAAAVACAAAGEAHGLSLHLGLHAGDVIRESDNVYGGAVNIASRISALSAPGEILVSDVVRALARTSAGVAFDDRGEHALKGIDEPHRVYAVRSNLAGRG